MSSGTRYLLAAAVGLAASDCAIPRASAFTPIITSADMPCDPGHGTCPPLELEPPREPDGDHEPPGSGTSPGSTTPGPSEAPAHRYARLSRFECEAELTRRKVPFMRESDTRGVVAPVRLSGPIAGVTYHSAIPEKQRKTSPYEIFDCRLVLALEDFSRDLARDGIREVVHMSAYRPAAHADKKPVGFVGQRHEGALALDIGAFIKEDGTVIQVERDFHGAIGAKTCPNSVANKASASYWLRDLVCREHDRGLFHVMLTPNYNWAHRNHFHFEVTAAHRWFYLR